MAQEGNFYPKAAELGTAGRAVGPSMDDTESQSRDKVTQRETHGRDTKTQNGSPKLPNPQLGENAESGVCPRQGKVRSEVEAGKCPWWAEPILVGGVCLWRGPSRVCPWWGGVRTVGAVPVCSGQGPRTCAARPAAPNCSPGIIAEVHYERRAHLLPEDLRDPALRTGTKRAGREPGSDPRNAKTAPRVPGDTLRTSVSSSRRLRQDPKPLGLGTPGPAPAASDPDRRGRRHSGTRSHPAPRCAIPAPSPGPPCCRRSPGGLGVFPPSR